MFTYIDPNVRSRLIEQGKLIRIDADGKLGDANQAPGSGAKAINILGPIPLPLERHGRHFEAQWYASVNPNKLALLDQA